MWTTVFVANGGRNPLCYAGPSDCVMDLEFRTALAAVTIAKHGRYGVDGPREQTLAQRVTARTQHQPHAAPSMSGERRKVPRLSVASPEGGVKPHTDAAAVG